MGVLRWVSHDVPAEGVTMAFWDRPLISRTTVSLVTKDGKERTYKGLPRFHLPARLLGLGAPFAERHMDRMVADGKMRKSVDADGKTVYTYTDR